MKREFLITLFFALVYSLPSHGQIQGIKVSAEGNKSAICLGESIQLNVVPSSYGPVFVIPVFRWEPANMVDNPAAAGVIATPMETTLFRITVTDPVFNLVYSDSILIIVSPPPVINAGLDYSLCVNDPYALKPLSYKNATYQWAHNGKGTFRFDTTRQDPYYFPTYVPAPGESGTILFIFTGQGLQGCTSVSDTMKLNYFERPYVEIHTPDDSICSVEPFSLEASTNAPHFRWRHTGSGTFVNEKTLQPVYIPDKYDHGTLLIILDAMGDGCVNSDTVSLTINPIRVSPIPDQEVCRGTPTRIFAECDDSHSYLWSNGATSCYTDFIAFRDTSFHVVITNNLGCFYRDTVRVKVNPVPSNLLITNDYQNFRVIVTPTGYVKYTFYNVDGILQEGPSNSFDYRDAVGTDTILVLVTNEFGCTNFIDIDKTKTEILPAPVKVNAFSPNGDGINDRLLPYRNITVFDRTGKILYKGWDGWDGTLNGKEMPVGTYFYVVMDSDNTVFYKGPVTLLR